MFVVYDPPNTKDLTFNSGYNVSSWRDIGNSPTFPDLKSPMGKRVVFITC